MLAPVCAPSLTTIKHFGMRYAVLHHEMQVSDVPRAVLNAAKFVEAGSALDWHQRPRLPEAETSSHIVER